MNNIVTTIFLNANANRFKLLANDQEKSEFLGLMSVENFKEKTFMQLFNLIWSDNENYQFFKRTVESSTAEELKSPSQAIYPNPLSGTRLEYTPLVAQIFNECQLLERIMNKFMTIQIDNEHDPKKAVPAHKSHLIDMAETLNNYLKKYQICTKRLPEKLMETNNAELREEWSKFADLTLGSIKNKICEVEQNIRSQQNAQHDFMKFIFQDKVKPLEFESPYNVKEYEFSMQLFETQFDKAVKEKAINPELPSISTQMTKAMNQTSEYLSKFKGEIDLFSKAFDEERSIEDEEKEKQELRSTSEDTEQLSEAGEQMMSSLTDRDNIFQPLASSSNISNELNLEMEDMEGCKSD